MKKILIIGGGNMGFAIAQGILKKGKYKHKDVYFTETNKDRIRFLKKYKFIVFKNLDAAINKSRKIIEIIILAVKPNDITLVIQALKNKIHKKTIVVSIAAGIKIKKISSLLLRKQPIARIMPNTPCQIGEGMSVITYNKNISKNHKIKINEIFQSIGKTVELKEDKFDLVGAINGSGPAYFCYLIESLIESALKLGIKKEIATTLVIQSAYGTSYLLSKHLLTPKELRESVTSKKGITEAALRVFQKNNFNSMVFNAVQAARVRSIALGKA